MNAAARWLIGALLLAATGTQASENVSVTLHRDWLADGSGSGIQGLWYRSDASGGVMLGVARNTIQSSGWSTVDLGGFRRLTPGTLLQAGSTLGHGTDVNGRYGYLKLRAGVTQNLGDRWSVRLDSQYIDIATSHGLLVSGGIDFRPYSKLALRLDGGYSSADSLNTQYVLGGVQYFGRLRWYGGLSFGETTPDLADFGIAAQAGDLTQAHVGLGIPLGSDELSLTGEYVDLDGVSRYTLRIGFRRQIQP